ncbi:MAG TPA: hypothetical protein RMH80_22000, partial [Polyangiaceae bacterium LLY-WYZ-15_(1-7)]|nr:hypothetical protein [Polyangiaceae bacterium LLY-WYZ-15_(1-7)]
MARAALIGALVLAGLVGGAARADDVDACLEELAALSPGASLEGRGRAFATPGREAHGAFGLPRSGCATFVAKAVDPAADLDGLLRTREGRDLARDDGPRPWVWLRFCGREGLELHWSVASARPTEVRVGWLVPGPERPGAAARAGRCFARQPGLRGAPPELGPPPPTPTADERARRLGEALRARGWRVSAPTPRRVEPGEVGRELRLAGGRCHALHVFAAEGLRLDGRLLGPDGAERVADRRGAADVALALCLAEPATLALQLSVAGRAGEATLVRAEIPLPAGEAPGAGAIARAELRAGADDWAPRGRVHLLSGESLRLPLPRGAECRRWALVSEGATGLWELALEDPTGRLVAHARGS